MTKKGSHDYEHLTKHERSKASTNDVHFLQDLNNIHDEDNYVVFEMHKDINSPFFILTKNDNKSMQTCNNN